MSLSTEINKVVAVGNDNLSIFKYGFKIQTAKDLLVKVKNPDTAEVTTLENNVHYKVLQVNTDTEARVELLGTGFDWLSGDTSNLSDGWRMLMINSPDLKQEFDFRNAGEFFASLHEDAFDRSRMIDQKLLEVISRAIRLNEFSTVPLGEIADPVEGLFLKWDENNNLVASKVALSDLTEDVVTSVNDRSGVIILDKSDVNLDRVDNTSDEDKISEGPIKDYIDNYELEEHINFPDFVRSVNGEHNVVVIDGISGVSNLKVQAGSEHILKDAIGPLQLQEYSVDKTKLSPGLQVKVEEIEAGNSGIFALKNGGFNSQVTWAARNINSWTEIRNGIETTLSFGSARFFREVVEGVDNFKNSRDSGRTLALEYSETSDPSADSFDDLSLIVDVKNVDFASRTFVAVLSKPTTLPARTAGGTVWTAFVDVTRAKYIGEGGFDNPLELKTEEGETFYTIKPDSLNDNLLTQALRNKINQAIEASGQEGGGSVTRTRVGGASGVLTSNSWTAYNTLKPIEADKFYQFTLNNNGQTLAPIMTQMFLGQELIDLGRVSSTTRFIGNTANPGSLALNFGRNNAAGARSFYVGCTAISTEINGQAVSALQLNMPDTIYRVTALNEFSFSGPRGETGPRGIQGLRGERGLKGDKGDIGSGSLSEQDRKTIENSTRITLYDNAPSVFYPEAFNVTNFQGDLFSASNLEGQTLTKDQFNSGAVLPNAKSIILDLGSETHANNVRNSFLRRYPTNSTLKILLAIVDIEDPEDTTIHLYDIISDKDADFNPDRPEQAQNYSFVDQINIIQDDPAKLEFVLETRIVRFNYNETNRPLYYVASGQLINSNIIESGNGIEFTDSDGLAGIKVRRNSLTGRELREGTITSREIAPETIPKTHIDTEFRDDLEATETAVEEIKDNVNLFSTRTMFLNRPSGENATIYAQPISGFGRLSGGNFVYQASITKGRGPVGSKTDEIELEFEALSDSFNSATAIRNAFVRRIFGESYERTLFWYNDRNDILAKQTLGDVSNLIDLDDITRENRYRLNGAFALRTVGVTDPASARVTIKLSKPIHISETDLGDRTLYISGPFSPNNDLFSPILAPDFIDLTDSNLYLEKALRTNRPKLKVRGPLPGEVINRGDQVLNYGYSPPTGGTNNNRVAQRGFVDLTRVHFRKNGETTKPHLLKINNTLESNYVFAYITLTINFNQFTSLPVGAKAHFITEIRLNPNVNTPQKDSRIILKTRDTASTGNANWRVKLWTAENQNTLNTTQFRNDNVIQLRTNFLPNQQLISPGSFTIFKEDTNTLSVVDGIF